MSLPTAPEAAPPRHRARDREASQRRMLDAAAALFTRYGYDDVTVRMIASAAQVNVALINRYFGSKFKLFEAAIATRSPAPDLSATELRQLPRQLADYAVQPRPSRPSMRALVGAAGSTEAQELLRNLLETALIQQIATRLPGPDALQRARMATAILIGAATARSVFGPADLPDDELTERLTAVLRTCLID